MNIPAHLRDLLFKALAGLTAPLKGYRTAIGIVGAVALVVYGVMTANFELAGVALTLLFGLIGLRPENPPSADNPSVPMPPPALLPLAALFLAGAIGCSSERGCYSTDGREPGKCRCCMKCVCGGKAGAEKCCCE